MENVFNNNTNGSFENSIEKQVAETVKRAFWDAFKAKMDQDPPDYSMAYGTIKEAKEV